MNRSSLALQCNPYVYSSGQCLLTGVLVYICLRVGVRCVVVSVCGCWLCVCGVGAEFLLKIVGIISPPIPCRACVESFINKLHESC